MLEVMLPGGEVVAATLVRQASGKIIPLVMSKHDKWIIVTKLRVWTNTEFEPTHKCQIINVNLSGCERFSFVKLYSNTNTVTKLIFVQEGEGRRRRRRRIFLLTQHFYGPISFSPNILFRPPWFLLTGNLFDKAFAVDQIIFDQIIINCFILNFRDPHYFFLFENLKYVLRYLFFNWSKNITVKLVLH